MSSLVGQTLKERYEITAEVGAGAMGDVYLATDHETGKTVAVKILSRTLAGDAEYRKRFSREVTAMRKMNHPNIVGYVDTFAVEGEGYLVMEYVEGQTLEDYIHENGPMPVDIFLTMAIKITDGLSSTHKLGVYHRDLKPANILLDEDGNPYITDFGVAKSLDLSTMTASGEVLGTIAYLPPESMDSYVPLDHRGDIWALGVIFFEMLTGLQPFEAPSQAGLIYAIITAQPRSLKNVRDDLPPELDVIITHCLEKHPQNRYADVEFLLEDLLIVQGADVDAVKIDRAHQFWERGQKTVAIEMLEAMPHNPKAQEILSNLKSGE